MHFFVSQILLRANFPHLFLVIKVGIEQGMVAHVVIIKRERGIRLYSMAVWEKGVPIGGAYDKASPPPRDQTHYGIV